MTERVHRIHLILKYKWYDLIEQGKKSVEYRRNTERLRKILRNKTYVVFHRGYTGVTMMFKIFKWEVHSPAEIYIHLGERIE